MPTRRRHVLTACSADLRVRVPWRPAGQCKVADCQIQRAQLKQTVADQSSAIGSLKTRLNSRLKDEVVSFKEEARQHEVAAATLASDLHVALRMRASVQRSLRQLEAASIEQTHTIAQLTEEVASLHFLLAERAREATHVQEQAVVEVKRHARAERQWSHPAKQIAALSAQTEAQAAAAAAQMKELSAKADAELADLTAKCEARVSAAVSDGKRAHADAVRARADAVAEAQLAREAEAASEAASHAHEMKLLERRLKRAEQRATKVVAEEYRPAERSPEEWAALSFEAERSASRRERQVLRSFLGSRAWRAEDLAAVLHEGGTLARLFNTKEGTGEYMARAQKLLEELERLHFGNEFALFLHFELHLTLDKVHRIMQAVRPHHPPLLGQGALLRQVPRQACHQGATHRAASPQGGACDEAHLRRAGHRDGCRRPRGLHVLRRRSAGDVRS